MLYYLDASGWFASALPTIVLHELGHCIAILCCGGTIRGIYLEVFGLRLDTRLPLSRRREALCALAGPMCGYLWCLLYFIPHGSYVQKSIEAALVLNSFNLLPAYPLDGGRILYAVFPYRSMVRIMDSAISLALLLMGSIHGQMLLFLPAFLLIRYAITA